MKRIKIDTEYIKLDQFLKFAGVAQTGGEAKMLIQESHVKLNGQVVNERGKKVKKGDKIEIENIDEFVVI